MSQYAPDEQVMVSPRYMAGAGLRGATDRTRGLADGLDSVRPAFTAEPPARAAPLQPVPYPVAQRTAATTPTPPADRRR